MRAREVWGMVAICLAVTAGTTFAAELGRRDVSGDAVKKGYGSPVSQGVGGEISLYWNSVDVDIGPLSRDDKAWAPQASLFLGMNDMFDLRATVKFFYAEDEDQDSSMDLNVVRLGLGGKFTLDTEGDLDPFASLHLNYYFLSVDGSGTRSASDEEGMLGISLDAGVQYALTELIFIRAALQFETSLDDGEVTIRDTSNASTDIRDISLNTVGFGIGIGSAF